MVGVGDWLEILVRVGVGVGVGGLCGTIVVPLSPLPVQEFEQTLLSPHVRAGGGGIRVPPPCVINFPEILPYWGCWVWSAA